MWLILHNGSTASLLDRAKEKEKRYKWLQAAKDYEKASELSSILNINSEEVINLKKTIELASITRKKRKIGFPVSAFYNKKLNNYLILETGFILAV